MALHPRGIIESLQRAIREFPVVVLEGGRAVGKSTLCRTLIDAFGWSPLLDLTDPGVIESIRLDPIRYLSTLPTPVFIDEAQLLPELTLWVKRVVDQRQGASGQFVLTGSARLGRDQLGGSDPLAGRSVRLRLWSLTPDERADRPTPIAASLFADEFAAGARTSEWDIRAWLRGGLPGLAGVLSNGDSATWDRAVSAYVESVIPIGVSSPRVDHGRLLRAFRYIAANTGQHLNIARMSSELGVTAETARSYLASLENCFLVFRVDAHRPSEHKVLTAHPRVFATDVGLASWAARVLDTAPSAGQLGSLLENQIAHALGASTDWSNERIVLRHWRDQRSKREVDLLLVRGDGRTVPIEVKASTSVGPADTEGLVAFALANAGSMHRAHILYCGTRTIDLSPPEFAAGSIVATPLGHLFGPGSAPAAGSGFA